MDDGGIFPVRSKCWKIRKEYASWTDVKLYSGLGSESMVIEELSSLEIYSYIDLQKDPDFLFRSDRGCPSSKLRLCFQAFKYHRHVDLHCLVLSYGTVSPSIRNGSCKSQSAKARGLQVLPRVQDKMACALAL
jgi:hypothetical protein